MNYAPELIMEANSNSVLSHVERIFLIEDILKKYRLLGIEREGSKAIHLWYNDTFDYLYESSDKQLLKHDDQLRTTIIANNFKKQRR